MSVCLNDTDGDGDCAACARDPKAPCRVSARNAIHRLFESGRTSYRLDVYLDAYAHELEEKIQDAMETTRATDWGRSNRSKRPFLMGMEKARKAIAPEVSGGS